MRNNSFTLHFWSLLLWRDHVWKLHIWRFYGFLSMVALWVVHGLAPCGAVHRSLLGAALFGVEALS